MPEVGIYDSPEVNAFATGPSKSRSLVAVSSGLLRAMRPNEVEGVLAHEVAHIANGDMVTMTLLQGVMNAFVMFFARLIATLAVAAARATTRGYGGELPGGDRARDRASASWARSSRPGSRGSASSAPTTAAPRWPAAQHAGGAAAAGRQPAS